MEFAITNIRRIYPMYIVCVNETVYGYQSCRYTSFTLLKGGGLVCVSLLYNGLIDVSVGNVESSLDDCGVCYGVMM